MANTRLRALQAKTRAGMTEGERLRKEVAMLAEEDEKEIEEAAARWNAMSPEDRAAWQHGTGPT